jgi:hypothetical protein
MVHSILVSPVRSQSSATGCQFLRPIIRPTRKVSRMMFEAPLTDLQDAGASKIPSAVSKSSLWIRSSQDSLNAALEAITIIDFLSPTKLIPRAALPVRDYTPYSIITLFICHTTLWAFVSFADATRKSELRHLIDSYEALNSAPISTLLRWLLTYHRHDSINGGNYTVNSQKLLFRSAAEGLTRMGTWGCSLNPAMMLYRRPRCNMDKYSAQLSRTISE